MGVRGRKSAADLAVIQGEASNLPRPPAGLTDEQANEWRAVAPSLPSLTRAMYPLLEAYCQHAVALRHVRQLVEQDEQSEEFDDKAYDRHLRMQERESRCLASLGVRLGIAQSTSYERQKRNGNKKAPSWQIEV